MIWDPRGGWRWAAESKQEPYFWGRECLYVTVFWLTGIFLSAAAGDSSILFHTSAPKRVLISFGLKERKKSPHHITFYPLEGPLSVTQAPNWPLHHVLSPSAGPCFAATSHSFRRKVKRHKGRVITASACWKGTQRKHEVWAALKTPSGARIYQVFLTWRAIVRSCYWIYSLQRAHHHNLLLEGSSRGTWSFCRHVRGKQEDSSFFGPIVKSENSRMYSTKAFISGITYCTNDFNDITSKLFPRWTCDLHTRD